MAREFHGSRHRTDFHILYKIFHSKIMFTQFLTNSLREIISIQNALFCKILREGMNTMQYTCGQCEGTNFPGGMFIFFCPVCKTSIHPGCWDAHARRHTQDHETLFSDQLKPRRGKISAYGIIQWDN